MVTKGNYRRTSVGNAMTEIGPALLILLMTIFFPVLDMMSMAASYGSALYLNMQQTKEASVVPATDATSPTGQVQKGVVDNWLSHGIGIFVKTTEYPKTTVSYRDGTQDSKTKITDKLVIVTTTVTCQPFLVLPWFTKVAGINAPMTFQISSEAPMESPDNAG